MSEKRLVLRFKREFLESNKKGNLVFEVIDEAYSQ